LFQVAGLSWIEVSCFFKINFKLYSGLLPLFKIDINKYAVVFLKNDDVTDIAATKEEN